MFQIFLFILNFFLIFFLFFFLIFFLHLIFNNKKIWRKKRILKKIQIIKKKKRKIMISKMQLKDLEYYLKEKCEIQYYFWRGIYLDKKADLKIKWRKKKEKFFKKYILLFKILNFFPKHVFFFKLLALLLLSLLVLKL